MDLTVRGLSGNAEYVLYEDGTVIARDTTTSGGRWNGSIHDVGSSYELVRSETGTTIPIIPPEKELNMKIRTGHYKEGNFVPTAKFNTGEKVTVVVRLSADGEGVSHGEVNGFWNGNPFTFEDRKGNKFVGAVHDTERHKTWQLLSERHRLGRRASDQVIEGYNREEYRGAEHRKVDKGLLVARRHNSHNPALNRSELGNEFVPGKISTLALRRLIYQ